MRRTNFALPRCLIVFVLLVGMGGVANVRRCRAEATAKAAAYPAIEIREENGSSRVYCDGKLIVELKDNRFLRFRATPADENWIGTERQGADLCWAYNDPQAKGLQVLGTAHSHTPDKGEFALVVHAKKPHFESKIDLVFRGKWMPEAAKFKYSLYTSLECSLESWYQNSTIAQKQYELSPTAWVPIEVTDYHIEYISMPDRNMSADRKEPQKYEWFVRSDDGLHWAKWPKIHIPYVTRPGNYITIADRLHPSGAGNFFGFVDKTHGGWLTRIVKTPHPIDFELCWMFFDVHIPFRGGIPPRYSTETLSLDLEMAFEPVDAERGRELVRDAVEVGWRGMNAYRLPLFSWNNKFDTLLTDVPSDETANHYIWWASSNDCFRDDTTGCDDHFSASIKRQGEPVMPAAWNTVTWCHPYTTERIKNRRIRFSAMVKTSHCTGPVRLAICDGSENFYGPRNHHPDGTIKTVPWKWQFSAQSVSGTTDWTPISMEFVGDNGKISLILEQNGGGQCWFDNVKIEDLGKATGAGR